MTIKQQILEQLTGDNLSDQQVAYRIGANEPSVRRARLELERNGDVLHVSGNGTFYSPNVYTRVQQTPAQPLTGPVSDVSPATTL